MTTEKCVQMHKIEESPKGQLFRMGTCKRGKGGRLLCEFEPIDPESEVNLPEETETLDADLIEDDDLNSDEDVDSDSEPEEE